ncbi:MAG: FkbM family methyltransferase [Candidatus Aminicenantes bacterium]|nr:FkbM family methyltransferase [Candidatus Aminicenantes bacterium]
MDSSKKRIRLLLAILITVTGAYLLYDYLATKAQSKSLRQTEANWLTEKYGPKLYSQNDEELIIRDFYNDRKGGFFVDVGAGHYQINSTTYYLEKHLGWRGIAIDAIPNYEKQYLEKRKNTHYFSFFVADRSDTEVDFYMIQKNRRLSTGDEEAAKKEGEYTSIKVPTITLNDLLDREEVIRFDLLSMDIELAEPAALAGFDIRRFKPSLVCIEAHEEVRDQILDYFNKNDYIVIDKYKGLDPLNIYFTPKR